MSTMALSWALNAHATGPMAAEARLVLAALADYAGADAQAWPSAATLADQLAVSVRSVRRHLATLEELGLIGRGDQQLVAHYRADRRPVVWRLELPMPPRRGVTEPAPRDVDGVTAVTARGDSGGRDGVTALSPKPRTKPPMETTPPQPPGEAGGSGCPLHPIPVPRCRGCGTTGRQLRAVAERDAAEEAARQRRERPPLCERCGVRHPGYCQTLMPPPAGWRANPTTSPSEEQP